MADELTDELSVRPQFFAMWLPEQTQDILGAFLRAIHPREQSRSFHTFSVSSWKSPIIGSAMLLVSQTALTQRGKTQHKREYQEAGAVGGHLGGWLPQIPQAVILELGVASPTPR